MAEHDIAAAINATTQQIRDLELQYDRQPGSVTLLAVSKTKPATAIRAAYDAGHREFGENFVEEGVRKREELQLADSSWHFIGAIQSNKTATIAEHFDWVHGIDREKIARRLSSQRPAHLPPLNCCIQVNPDGETSKAGLPPESVAALCDAIAGLPNIRLRGLMTIPAPRQDVNAQREVFRQIAQLQSQLRSQFDQLDTLSMGMSADMEAAIAEGATIVRIGTALFGSRK